MVTGIEPTERTRRRLLVAPLVAGLSAAALGPGTDAAIGDSERGKGHAAISTGTLDLKIDGGDSVVRILNLSGIRPGGYVRLLTDLRAVFSTVIRTSSQSGRISSAR